MDDVFSNYEQAVLTLFRAVPLVERDDDRAGAIRNAENVEHGMFITERAVKACPALREIEAQKFLWDAFGYDMLAMNRGFYQNFHEVQEVSVEKWLIDQLLHYLTVYLQNEDMTNDAKLDSNIVFVPATKLQLPDGEPIRLTVIDVLAQDDIVKRTWSMINSGMALSQKVLQCIAVILKETGMEVEIKDVPNKELRIYLYDMLGKVPPTAQEFLRLLIFHVTGSTLLIKSQDVIALIRDKVESSKPGYYTAMFQRFVAENNIKALAAEFLRYKKLWLAFKKDSAELAHLLNRVRKLADRCKYVKKTGILERITWDDTIEPAEAAREIPHVTIYKRISLANSLLYRAQQPKAFMYLIRNGKAYAKAATREEGLTVRQQQILNLLLESIVETIKAKAAGKKFFIPTEVEYAMPVSEKRFIGGVPFGSSLKLSQNGVLGIHWENLPDARVDLDFHYVSQHYHVGWNTQFDRKQEIIFSGDMTDAPPEKGGATEAFFLSEKLVNDWAAVMLNRYTDNLEPVPYKFVLGAADTNQLSKDYLLNCHTMAISIKQKIERNEDFLGFVHADAQGEKTFYFLTTGFGSGIVARYGKEEHIALEAVWAAVKSCLKLREVLMKAGGILVNNVDEAEVDLSLDKVTKDTFVNLFEQAAVN